MINFKHTYLSFLFKKFHMYFMHICTYSICFCLICTYISYMRIQYMFMYVCYICTWDVLFKLSKSTTTKRFSLLLHKVKYSTFISAYTNVIHGKIYLIYLKIYLLLFKIHRKMAVVLLVFIVFFQIYKIFEMPTC